MLRPGTCAYVAAQWSFKYIHSCRGVTHRVSVCVCTVISALSALSLEHTSDSSSVAHWRLFPKRSLYQWSKNALNQTSCIFCFRLWGRDTKVTLVSLHADCFHSPWSRAAYSPAWQISAGCLAFSHHHSSPGELDLATDAYVTEG